MPNPPDPSPAAWLTPLQVREHGTWDPATHPCGDAATEEWVAPILARGPRPLFEMEQVLPGEDPDDPDTDPILDAVELHESGQPLEAHRLLLQVAERDPRCIDAHVLCSDSAGNACGLRRRMRQMARYTPT